MIKNFDIQEGKLKASLEIKDATNEVIRASQRLSDVFQDWPILSNPYTDLDRARIDFKAGLRGR